MSYSDFLVKLTMMVFRPLLAFVNIARHVSVVWIVWQISSQPFDQFPETRSGQSGHRQNMRRIKAIISQIATMSRPVLGRAATLSKVTPRWWTGVDAGGHGWRARRGSGPCPSTPDHWPGSRPLPHCCCICLSSNALLKIREKVAGISSGCWGRNQSLACCHLEVLSSVPRYAVAEYTGMQLRVSELHSSRLTNHSYHLDTNRKPYALLVTSDILHTLHTIHTLYVKIVERFLNQTLF